jgi:redox-regulated HSP33 family molecular chaperone
VEFAIKNLSKKELIDISDENGNIKVVCEFCNTERIFSSFN